ncbi:hypothetical protein THMIRHAS_06390 [Thiosulfatimonas sediminis]|uniref:NAD(P)-binding domain-containing protein n=1 Tax=Thiosulfatimonas sediminis TaxID=2675054 RepID=A0A6F8PT49_9GAMM|nr:hypothetical protein [Thiosulfatimonas sediminis]BBP45266.1 hypothetical protein THMIRHAS_06390 [Thiosulfatimonas sediminis]
MINCVAHHIVSYVLCLNALIKGVCGKKAKENLMPMQAGDVPITYADVDDLIADTGFKPSTSIEDGIGNFVEWYKKYYKLAKK